MRLGSGDLGDGDAVWRAGHVVHIDPLEEGDGVRIVRVVPADAYLYVPCRKYSYSKQAYVL